MLTSFYYKNDEQIDSLYAQTREFVMKGYEKHIRRKKRGNFGISVGSLLKCLGINIGDIKSGVDIEKESIDKVFYELTQEQKLAVIVKSLQEKGKLKEIGSDSEKIPIGSYACFEGNFTVCEDERSTGDACILQGLIRDRNLRIVFSRAKVEPSIMGLLSYSAGNTLISGLGILARNDPDGILIRPIAFGSNFTNMLTKLK